MHKTTAKYAATAALAAIAAYAAGILTAPKSGKETREDIRKAAQKAKREAEKHLKAIHSELDQLIVQGKSFSTKLSSTAKQDWEAVFKVAVTAKEKVRNALSALHEGGAETKDLEKAVHDATKAIDHVREFIAKHQAANSATSKSPKAHAKS